MASGDLAKMKQTLALARVAVEEMREGADVTRRRLTRERTELETVRRRRAQAAAIGDAETVRVAERFEAEHAQRVAVLERKLHAQQEELSLAERDVAAMTAELRAAVQGGPRGPAPRVPEPEADPARAELDELARKGKRAARDAEAEEKLAALKRRMGK
ncbi:MAG TPA: hypothetical protein VNA89_12180 [Gemmatimonadaceae bacterium]|nr:hypothetical protein [Gemmatimonadaceae bacterium]